MIVRLLMVALLWASPSVAQDMRALARQKFDEGRLQFAEGHFEKALVAFRESYQLAPYPDLLFNIARCEAELGHHRAVFAAYERYLAVNPRDEEARRRADELRPLAAEEPLPPLPPPPPIEPSPTPSPLWAPAAPPATPVYRKWWLWTAVVGVVGVALGVGLGVGLSGAEPGRTFPPLNAQ